LSNKKSSLALRLSPEDNNISTNSPFINSEFRKETTSAVSTEQNHSSNRRHEEIDGVAFQFYHKREIRSISTKI
jgi:hypothetical protein